jgi:hypothetical protein
MNKCLLDYLFIIENSLRDTDEMVKKPHNKK